MKKKLLVSGALALTCASCLALAGCDLFGSSSSGNNGGSGNGDISWGGVTGPTVTENEWENAFGNERYSKNFTTDISATVTVETSDGEEDGVSRATGLFRVDGGKNYSSVEANGYLMEMYELHNSADDYTWVRFGDSSVWEQESVNGLPLSAVMLADYVDCYDCFEYDSKTKSYIATDSGRRHLTDIFVRSQVGELPADEEISYELTEASFTLSNGLPVAAHMRFVMDEKSKDGRWAHIDQNLNYTFSDFGATKVEFPTQIQQWLKENGVDVDEPSKEDPVNPTPSGKLSEKEWVDIFTNEKTYENYTNYVYAEGEAVMYSSSGKVLDKEGFIMNAFLYADGDKMHATMQDGADEEVEEIYLYRQGSTYHNWTKDLDKGGWEYDGANIPNTYRVSFINFNALARAYRYFDYNPSSDQYEANEKGLAALRASLFEDTLVKESVLSEITQWTEFSVRIQNGKIAAVYCTATFSETDGKNKMEMSFSMNMDFNDYNKTTVKFPAAIQKQIEELGGSTQPVDPVKPSGSITEREWMQIFGEKNATNYAVDISGAIEATAGGYTTSVNMNGKFHADGNKGYAVTKSNAGGLTYTDYTYSYRTDDKNYAWVLSGSGWSEVDNSNGSVGDTVWLADFADCYDYFRYNSGTGCYEATQEGLKVLSDRYESEASEVSGIDIEMTISEMSFVLGSNTPISMSMNVRISTTLNGYKSISDEDLEYTFSNFGSTKVTFPAEIQKQIDSLGGGSNLPVEPDNPDNPDNPDDKPVVSEGTKGLEYSLNSDGKGYSVNGIGTAKGTVIVIPAEYNGLPVTEIRNNALQYNETITSVVIPEGVSTIGSGAFRGCSALESIVIAKSVTSIGSSAFRDCTSLTTVYYAGSATDWEAVSVASYNSTINNTTLCFYSASRPVSTGNYWHYVADMPVKW